MVKKPQAILELPIGKDLGWLTDLLEKQIPDLVVTGKIDSTDAQLYVTKDRRWYFGARTIAGYDWKSYFA